MSYTIDVYRGEVAAQKNILTFATYVTLFPQLIAGPIVQYKTVEKERMHRKSHAVRFFRRSISFFRGSGKESASGKSDRKSVEFHFTAESHVGGYGMAWCNCIQFFRFILIFRDILIWRSDWAECLDSISWKTLISRTCQRQLRNSGDAGIFL